ncbi:MAG: deoxyuridine 5'-triphosphate nucleotidohydrolase [Clostridia bacterium]|nr:deoxyuridine 5'-triphosphate nucleotidohydrolase [Clostridia bacterium]
MKSKLAEFYRVSAEQYISDGGAEQDYNNIVLPLRATSGSAGYDFFAPCDIELCAGHKLKVPTGIRIKLTNWHLLMIVPKSGLGCKYSLGLANTVGIIDSDYYNADNEGHIIVWIVNNGNEHISIAKGKAFVQGLLLSHSITEELPITNNRKGGFGSTKV